MVAGNALAWTYVSSERSFLYFWDWSRYWIIYLDEAARLKANVFDGLAAAAASIRVEDYNVVPVFPLMPAEWAFGPGRLPYILAIVNLLLLPSGFLLALAAWRIQSGRSPVALAFAATAILCLHPWWVPALRGLPDVLGVGVIGLVLWVYSSAPLTEQSPVRLVTIGLLLGGLALTRRYYMFWVVAFYPAAALAEFYRLQAVDASQRLARYAIASGHLAIIGLVCLCAIVIAAPDLVWRIFQTNYTDIYSAYRSGTSLFDAAVAALDYFGALPTALSAAGLASLVSRGPTRPFGILVIVQAFIIFVLFANTQDFGAQHYYLLLPALGLGVAAAVISLWQGAQTLPVKVGGLIAILLAGAASSAAVLAPAAGVSEVLPRARFYPLARGDLLALNQLLDRLSQLPGRGKIYVLSSSTILNSSMLQVACQTQGRPKAFCERILRTHDVDKRDGFPERFLQADYVVLATPVQYHLRPADQQVIGLLAEPVSLGRGVGASLERLPGEFRLDQGVRVQIYARTAPFKAADVAALKRRFLGSYPAMPAP